LIKNLLLLFFITSKDSTKVKRKKDISYKQSHIRQQTGLHEVTIHCMQTYPTYATLILMRETLTSGCTVPYLAAIGLLFI